MKAPGYRTNPHHHIVESPVDQTVRVTLHGEMLAESTAVIRVDEDGHPPRFYFPRSDVHVDKLERSPTVTRCPFKGTASYFTLNVGGERFSDALWSYEEPYDEHQALKGRLAFYEETIPQLEIRVGDSV